MLYKKQLISLGVLVAVAAFAVSAPAFADTNSGQNSGQSDNRGAGAGMMGRPGFGRAMGVKPAVVGKVTAINGNTISVTSRGFGRMASSTTNIATTYTIDASNATVTKANAVSSVSSIVVGDNIVVQGTLSGTNVVATKIFDGPAMGRGASDGKRASTTPAFVGNGQPVVAGTVSSVSGSTITITNSGSNSYTVDASNAKVQVAGNASATVSNIATGDRVIVQGAVSGTSITATSVIDQGAPKVGANGTTPAHTGFFGSIGGFFKHLFGF